MRVVSGVACAAASLRPIVFALMVPRVEPEWNLAAS